MRIKTRYDPPPIPDRRFDWSALDEDRYDGAPDSRTRGQIGYGATERAALAELHELLADDHCARPDHCFWASGWVSLGCQLCRALQRAQAHDPLATR